MTIDEQKQLLKNILSGFANKYGVIDMNRGINFFQLHPDLRQVSREDLVKYLLEFNKESYYIDDEFLYSLDFDFQKQKNIFLAYYEYPEPLQKDYQDVVGFEDKEHLPVSPELQKLQDYCASLCQKSNKTYVVDEFVSHFYAWCNTIPYREKEEILSRLETYFSLSRDNQLIELFHQAVFVQPSWLHAGLSVANREKDQWFDALIEQGRLSIQLIDSIEQFLTACSNYYGVIEVEEAYRLYKEQSNESALSFETFSLIEQKSENIYLLPGIEGAIVSQKLYNEQFGKALQGSITEENKEGLLALIGSLDNAPLFLYFNLMYLRSVYTGKYKTLKREDFLKYSDPLYVPPCAPLDELKALLSLDKEDVRGVRLFNDIFSAYANAIDVSSQMERLQGRDATEIESIEIIENILQDLNTTFLGPLKKDNANYYQAINLILDAMNFLPSWILRGYSFQEKKALLLNTEA